MQKTESTTYPLQLRTSLRFSFKQKKLYLQQKKRSSLKALLFIITDLLALILYHEPFCFPRITCELCAFKSLLRGITIREAFKEFSENDFNNNKQVINNLFKFRDKFEN